MAGWGNPLMRSGMGGGIGSDDPQRLFRGGNPGGYAPAPPGQIPPQSFPAGGPQPPPQMGGQMGGQPNQGPTPGPGGWGNQINSYLDQMRAQRGQSPDGQTGNSDSGPGMGMGQMGGGAGMQRGGMQGGMGGFGQGSDRLSMMRRMNPQFGGGWGGGQQMGQNPYGGGGFQGGMQGRISPFAAMSPAYGQPSQQPQQMSRGISPYGPPSGGQQLAL